MTPLNATTAPLVSLVQARHRASPVPAASTLAQSIPLTDSYTPQPGSAVIPAAAPTAVAQPKTDPAPPPAPAVGAPLRLAMLDEPPAPVQENGRLTASVLQLLKEYPEPSDRRDQLLLWCFLREARSAEDVARYKPMLADPEARFNLVDGKKPVYARGLEECVEGEPIYTRAFAFNQNQTGKTADEIGSMVDRFRSIYPEIQALATPLPAGLETQYRYSTPTWKAEAMARLQAHGSLEAGDLYEMRGLFPPELEKSIPGLDLVHRRAQIQIRGDQAAVYTADQPGICKSFGSTCCELKLSSPVRYLDTMDPEILCKLQSLCDRHGVTDKKTGYGDDEGWMDLLSKAGIDMTVDTPGLLCHVRNQARQLEASRPELGFDQAFRQTARELCQLYRPEWHTYRIYNPAIIRSVS